MPTVKYEIIVSVSKVAHNPPEIPAAKAASYLAYADQTDMVGYHGNIYDVDVHEGIDSYGVALFVEFPVASPDDQERFEDEMDALSRVELFEEVS